MKGSCANAYVYAKASGILSHSFFNQEQNKLFDLSSLEEVWGLFFREEIPHGLSKADLAKEIEKRSLDSFVSQFSDLLDCYDSVPDFMRILLLGIECNNLKKIIAALGEEKKDIPELTELKDYSAIKLDRWPNLEQMLNGTPFEWFLDYSINEPKKVLFAKIDQNYVLQLFDSLKTLPVADRKKIEEFLKEYYSFNNICWAVRLRVFYKMEKGEILPLLLKKSEKTGYSEDVLTKDCLKLLEYPLDSVNSWSNSVLKKYVNPVSSQEWKISPSYVQKEMNKKLVHDAYRNFHSNPVSLTSLMSFYFVKSFELDSIRFAVEKIRLEKEIS